MKNDQPKVFISYATEDKKVAQKLYSCLQEASFDPWMDKPPHPHTHEGLLAGEDWNSNILRALQSTEYVILLLSHTSVSKNGYVQREFKAAIDKLNDLPPDKITVIPIVLDEDTIIPNIKVGFSSLSQLQYQVIDRDKIHLAVSTLKAIRRRTHFDKAFQSIIVNTEEEFLTAIGDNRELIINSPLDLTQLHASWHKNVYFQKEYNGTSMVIREVSRLTIRSQVSLARLTVSPTYSTVIKFNDCDSISLVNLSIGHFPEAGTCTGGVLSFHRCSDIFIKGCDLFGCGTNGLAVDEVTNANVIETIIRECSAGILSAVSCQGVKFDACRFIANRTYSGITLDNVYSALFTECLFQDNQCRTYLIESSSCKGIIFKSCQDNNNKYIAIHNNGGLLNQVV